MTQRMFLLSILFILNSANPIFGFFGDLNNRTAQRVAQQKAAREAAEYRAARQTIIQEDVDTIITILQSMGYCLKSTFNLVTGRPKNGSEVAAGIFTISAAAVAIYIYNQED